MRKGALTDLIEEGLRRVLAESAPAARTSRVLPPVSSATGGLRPGVNLDDSAALLETEDLDAAGPRR